MGETTYSVGRGVVLADRPGSRRADSLSAQVQGRSRQIGLRSRRPGLHAHRLRAQKIYYKKNNKYAASLADLVHTGSFTKRMVNPDRGDYSVGFRPNKDGFELTLTPKQLDAEHRSFYADEDARSTRTIRARRTEKSPIVK